MKNVKDKHEVSDRMLGNLKEVAYQQDNYGMEKYNTPLSAKLDYDWLHMLTEELADGLKYLQCEIDRKQGVIKLLEAGMRSGEPKVYIECALDVLKVRGTGK